MVSKVELLAPAGDFERLEMAVHYGADAVYLAGTEFGMRAAAGNFAPDALGEAIRYCHKRGVQVHVTCNTLPTQQELERLPDFLALTDELGADALIIADLGVLSLANRYAPHVKKHVSTQLGVVNSETARVLHDMGACRAVLAREVSLEDIARIRAAIPADMELEAFVHGAMCVSFSGRCLLSNYMTGRDANRGACAQPCRWKYHLVEEKRPGEYFEISEDGGTHILNSRDMCMMEHLSELLDAGVSSLKIEGRMKSAYYAAVVTNAYRHALDELAAGKTPSPIWREELDKVSHRPYSTGFYFGYPGQYYPDSMYFSDAEVCAVVEHCGSDCIAKLTQRNKFLLGDRVDLLTKDGAPVAFTVDALWDMEGTPIESVPHPMMPFKMRLPKQADRLSMIRKLK